ncbi:hypothetical protein HCN44_009885 [Aphidius gifuensis]|uniref:Kinesin motor domain-containing protein n=1 Tax=Aphidius gifuensis TaxID=684658 RepID=A0A834XN47_APHGI|nr:kinesin-like protein KIF18A [Aphidius gifuensis]KAF7990150.1 hypothetical protein HCN44_009885 [Aphidius gifuensis]
MVYTKVFSPNKNRIKRRSIGKMTIKPSTSGATNSRTTTTIKVNNKTDSQASIKVIVRVRPINERESQDNYRQVIKVVDNKMLIFDPKEEENPFFYRGVQQKGRDLLKKQNKELEFIFDHVFDTDTTNEIVFDNTTKDIILDLLDGYNCSVFAYGATGAGKTHTMLGKDNDPGITYRTMAELFRQIDVQRDHRDFNLGVTYLEIYNENVQDLLHKSGPLALREDARAGVIVANLKIVTINNADELLSLLARGNKNRTQHPTDANQESSRSHAVFQVYVNISNKLDGQVKHVKLSMIDLAGSERASATGCKGARFKEGANINKSLLALGNCINNLADGVKHVPYRDSKLTRLLKDSLGGNCRTVMIANIGPSSLSYEDTYNTLRYANRAKKIKTNIKKNIINCQMHVTGYIKLVDEQKKEIDLLKQKILMMENQAIQRNHLPTSSTLINDDNDNIKQFSLKLADLYEMKKSLNEKILSLQSTDKILCCRIQYKIAADKRLKNLTNAVDIMNEEEQNASGKQRVNKSLLHFKRQRQVVKIQMEQAWNELQIVEHDLNKLNADIASSGLTDKLADKITIHLTQIEKSRLQPMYEHSRKICSLQQCEMESSDSVTRTMSRLLQQYYSTMIGHKIMTDKMKLDYKQLIKSLEGVKNIKWADNGTADSLEDLYCLTSLSTEELEDPINNEIPIYTAAYLDDNNTDTPLKPSTATPTSSTTTTTTTTTALQLSPIKYNNETVVIEDTMNSTVTLESPITKHNNNNNDKNINIINEIKANELNNTFNLIDNNNNNNNNDNNKAKKRQLPDKINALLINKISPKKVKKISPRIKTNSKPTTTTTTSTTSTTTKTILNGKENTKNLQKPPSVMSAKSIAILNKLKTEKPKLLSSISVSSSTINNSNGTNQTDAGKVLKLKERRAITGAHPYQKLQIKSRPPTTASATTTASSRVPW